MRAKYSPEEVDRRLSTLVEISREFGSKPDFVLAGGGNTSCKAGDRMFVKASGHQLADISREGFVEISLRSLRKIWASDYSDDRDEREAAVLADLMNSRAAAGSPNPGNGDSPGSGGAGLRPSVETLLHELFPHDYVVHTHPPLINGLTCSQEGGRAARRIFGTGIIWIPVVDPGYILAKVVKTAIAAHMAEHPESPAGQPFPRVVLLQNHGIFVAADSPEEIRDIYIDVFRKMAAQIGRKPEPATSRPDAPAVQAVLRELQTVLPQNFSLPFVNSDITAFIQSSETFHSLRLSITPDHIVYSGYRPLFVEDPGSVQAAVRAFIASEGFPPRIIAVRGLAMFASASSEKQCELARKLFEDNVKIAVYSESFGGIQFMPEDNINFIRNWEVEKYRESLSSQEE